jgi:CRP/FNR family transcriptional regulator
MVIKAPGSNLNVARFTLPITREMMANYLGLTIETASRQMSALKREGLINFKDSRLIEVPDMAALKVETGEGED